MRVTSVSIFTPGKNVFEIYTFIYPSSKGVTGNPMFGRGPRCRSKKLWHPGKFSNPVAFLNVRRNSDPMA
jgi:hypothetical protein